MGDEVVLATRHLRLYIPHLSIKLIWRWAGPFKITQKIPLVVYELDLTPSWHIHSAFHVSKLKKYNRSNEFIDILMDVEVKDVKQLGDALAGVRAAPSVISAERTGSGDHEEL